MSVLDRFDAMVKAGVPYETALDLARGFEADIEAAMVRGAQAVASTIKVDAQAERRRAKDRERKAKTSIPQNSAESAETLSKGSEGSPKPPPTPPNLSQEPPISPKIRVSRAEKTSAFEAFWAVYPRKVAKGRAEKAFPKALSQTTLETLIEAAKATGRLAEDAKFIPHPASWLNDKRWLDTTDPPDGGGGLDMVAKIDADRARVRAMIEAEEAA